jgi:hypothetical protein
MRESVREIEKNGKERKRERLKATRLALPIDVLCISYVE